VKICDEGKPQLYGTQITSSNLLYNLYEPQHVDKRRAKMGMGPLKDYLKKYKIDFNAPQEK